MLDATKLKVGLYSGGVEGRIATHITIFLLRFLVRPYDHSIRDGEAEESRYKKIMITV